MMWRPSLLIFGALTLWACSAGSPAHFKETEERVSAYEAPKPQKAKTPFRENGSSGPTQDNTQTIETLGLSDLTEAVLAHNLRIHEASARVKASLKKVAQATGSPDPILEIGIAPLTLHTGMGQKISYSHMFPWPGSLKHEGARHLEETLSEEALRHALAQQLVALAHMAYWDLAAVKPLTELWHEHHALMETLREATMGRIQNNRGLPEDAVFADAEIALAEQSLVDIQRLGELARSEIRALTEDSLQGDFSTEALPEASLSPPLALSQLLKELKRPELEAQKARIRAQEEGILASEAADKPQLGWGLEVYTMGDDWMAWPMLSFMIELPFSQDKRRARTDEAKALLRAEEIAERALYRELVKDAENAHILFLEALKKHENLEKLIIPSQERRFELALASYASGKSSFEAIMMATTALNEAKINWVLTQVDALKARTALQLALGLILQP